MTWKFSLPNPGRKVLNAIYESDVSTEGIGVKFELLQGTVNR